MSRKKTNPILQQSTSYSRSCPRCEATIGCLDVVYDLPQHKLQLTRIAKMICPCCNTCFINHEIREGGIWHSATTGGDNPEIITDQRRIDAIRARLDDRQGIIRMTHEPASAA